MLLLSRRDVEDLLDLDALIDALAGAMADLSGGSGFRAQPCGAESLLVVESRTAALAPLPAGSNDLLQPIERGLIDADHVHAEVGELVDETRPGAAHPNRSRSTSPSEWRCRMVLPPRWFCAPPARAAPGARSSSSPRCSWMALWRRWCHQGAPSG